MIVHEARPHAASGTPGEIVALEKFGIVVACGSGALVLGRVQLEGKSVVSGIELANGLRLKKGVRFALPETL